ncbi:hypothetical protein [Cupriavidus sp. CP313]
MPPLWFQLELSPFCPPLLPSAGVRVFASRKQGVWLFARFFGPGPILHGNIVRGSFDCLRISVKVISGFGERDQGRKVVLRDPVPNQRFDDGR